ncbi:hypothetical protein FKM82_010178 [Ascaphus truei]
MCVQLDNGSLAWKPSNTPECLEEVTDCLAPFIEDADVLNKTYRSGDKLIVSCREGFQTRYPDLDNMASLCQDDGTWDNLPMCQVCPLPPMVNHGDYVCHPQPCERYNHGTVIEFYCDPGYTLANDYRYITCQSGAWFPSYPVYCVKTDTSWPNTQETLLTTWKIVAFTASSVLLMLLFVIIIRIFQTKFKAHFLPRSPQDSSVEPDFVVVDGVPVMLPSYDEAVSSDLNVTPPGYISSAGQRSPTQTDEPHPPAYTGNTLYEESETCDSLLDSSDLLQSLHSSSLCHMRAHAAQNINSGEAASTSPSIDIADEIPLMDEEP